MQYHTLYQKVSSYIYELEFDSHPPPFKSLVYFVLKKKKTEMQYPTLNTCVLGIAFAPTEITFNIWPKEKGSLSTKFNIYFVRKTIWTII